MCRCQVRRCRDDNRLCWGWIWDRSYQENNEDVVEGLLVYRRCERVRHETLKAYPHFLSCGFKFRVDTSEDFRSSTPDPVQSSSGNRLRQLIANPRLSTLRQLSPSAVAFHAAPRAPSNVKPFASKEEEKPTNNNKNVLKRKTPHYLTTTQRQSMMTTKSGLPGMNDFASIKEQISKQRVTIHYGDGAPKLHLRISTFDPTNQMLFAEIVRSRPQSERVESYSRRTNYVSTTFEPDFLEKLQVQELAPPLTYLQRRNSDTSIQRDSLNTSASLNGPYEIVDARKIPQMTARGQVYDSSTLNAQTATPQTAFPPPSYQPRDTEVPRIDNVRNPRDSIRAVRELSTQFPGPPDLSKARFVYKGPEISLWDQESSRSSVQYPPAGATVQLLGSTSQLVFSDPALAPPQDIPDDVTWGDSQFSSPAFAPPSPVRIGKVANRVGRDKPPESEKSVDPFSEREDGTRTPPATRTPTNANAATVPSPLRKSMKPPSIVPMPSSRTRQALIPDGFELVTPGTAFSVGKRSRSTTDSDSDPFLDLGMAMDPGKSKRFTMRGAAQISGTSSQQSRPALPAPMASHKLSKTNEKLDRIADWVDNVDTSRLGAQPTRRDNLTLQNLHDRGKSIENLAIPWPETKHAGTPPSRLQKPPISRVKSVGKAPRKATPAPIHSGHTRKSLYLEPIVIPPRNGDMPEAIQVEYGSLEPRMGGSVLGDSEVLGMEDNMNSKRPRRVGKPS